MPDDSSEVQLIYDDDLDVTNHAVVAEASFQSSSNATPGRAEILLRDPDRDLTFTTGRRLKLIVDGQALWSGFALVKGRTSFFPAGDGREDTRARAYKLMAVDNNILWDARFLRRTANYLKAIPNITTPTYDGVLIKQAFANYIDTPSWLDTETFVDNVAYPAGGFTAISTANPWAWPEQGSKIRELMEDLARWSAAVYYIGPDDAVHYHGLQQIECPWGFSDKPNLAPIIGGGGFEGAYYGFREIDANEDATELATDAAVWGGSAFAGSGSTVVYRAVDDDLEDLYGKWQLAEQHFNETGYKLLVGVTQRANMIVFGNPSGTPGGAEPGSVVGEGPRGLRFPQWSYSFAWSSRNVPSISGTPRHLYPGDIVPIQLWMYSEDGGTTPLTKFLPLRSTEIKFTSAPGGLAHAFFRGSFDLRNTDSKFLWKYLRKREPKIVSTTLATADDSSDTAQTGALGQFEPTPAPDGSTTVFNIRFGYIPGTTILSLDGNDQRRGVDYTESDPDTGELTFADPPETGDNLWCVCRTVAGSA